MIGFAIGQPLYGPLSDRYGRKPMSLRAALGADHPWVRDAVRELAAVEVERGGEAARRRQAELRRMNEGVEFEYVEGGGALLIAAMLIIPAAAARPERAAAGPRRLARRTW